jgi:zinc-RING finger domain
MQSGDGAVAWNTKYSAWEFVHCGVCYLPFINPRNPEAPPPVPFWLTECSHVVCNNHLSELSLMALLPMATTRINAFNACLSTQSTI